MDESWRDFAVCAQIPAFLDLDLPDQCGVCQACPVRKPCGEFGIAQMIVLDPSATVGYGGMTPQQMIAEAKARRQMDDGEAA